MIKNVIILSILISVLSIAAMLGCGTDVEDEEKELTPVKFVSAEPLSGSTLLPDATLTVTFDGVPEKLSVTQDTVPVRVRTRSVSSTTIVTILGPFTIGELNLTITWKGGTYTLTYRVASAFLEGMALILEGKFKMGSNTDEAHDDERPVHTVYVDAFYMDIHEVTVGEYQQFVQETGHRAPDWDEVAHYSSTDQHPIVLVSWHDAMAYAKWTGKRLPTEAEWEKATRGGAIQQSYPWGNTMPDGTQCNFADKNLAHYWWADKAADDGYGHTAPVGSYPENEYSLHDMAGNVWEWCLDEYDAGFYAVSPEINPVSGIDNIEDIVDTFPNIQSARVLRGGSWLVAANNVRSAVRFRLNPDSVSNNIGFRCVMDLPP